MMWRKFSSWFLGGGENYTKGFSAIIGEERERKEQIVPWYGKLILRIPWNNKELAIPTSDCLKLQTLYYCVTYKDIFNQLRTKEGGVYG